MKVQFNGHTGAMAPCPPSDAVVTLRGLGRRFRGVFAGLDDDESPDDLARRPGDAGRSAADHIAHAAATLTRGTEAVDLVLAHEGPTVDERSDEVHAPAGMVEGLLDDLAVSADAFAGRIEHLGAADWARTADTPAGEQTALDLVWTAVDTALADLKAAELVLAEVRGRA
jgi:hypothetical protein